MKKTIIAASIIILALLVLGCLSCFTVLQSEYVIVTQFGKSVKTLTEPGLYLKLPGMIQKVNRFDRRINIFQTQLIQLLLGDKNPIILSCYVVWKIDNPVIFFQAVGNPENAAQKLSDMVNSQLGGIVGDYTIDRIINTNPEEVKLAEIEKKMLLNSNERAKEKYGIEIIQTGIRQVAYPSIVSDAVYERMKAERRKEANKYRAEGREEAAKIEAKTDKEVRGILADAYKISEITKGEGDGEAIRIYAEAYGKDPEFFQFLKSIEIYKDILGGKSTLILSTESELFKYLNPENSPKCK